MVYHVDFFRHLVEILSLVPIYTAHVGHFRLVVVPLEQGASYFRKGARDIGWGDGA